MGSLLGAVVAGLLIGQVVGLTTFFAPKLAEIMVFVVMAVVLLVRPSGLFGEAGPGRVSALRARRAGCAAHPVLAFFVFFAVFPFLVPYTAAGHPGADLRPLRPGLQPALRLHRAPVLRPRRLLRARAPTAPASRSPSSRWPRSGSALGAGLLLAVLGGARHRLLLPAPARHLLRDAHAGLRPAALLHRASTWPTGRAATTACAASRSSPLGLPGLAHLRSRARSPSTTSPTSLVGLAVAALKRILDSPFGAVLQAIRENSDRAVACGYDVNRDQAPVVRLLRAVRRARGRARRPAAHRRAGRVAVLDHLGPGRDHDAAGRRRDLLRPLRRRRPPSWCWRTG